MKFHNHQLPKTNFFQKASIGTTELPKTCHLVLIILKMNCIDKSHELKIYIKVVVSNVKLSINAIHVFLHKNSLEINLTVNIVVAHAQKGDHDEVDQEN